MKYITSCPKCDTHFLLDDQLIKAHRGKVQCGSCEHVFNAKTRLTEVAEEITSAEEYQAIVEEQENTDIEEIIIDAQSNDNAESTSSADSFLDELSPDTTTTVEPEPSLDVNTTPIVDDFINKTRTTKKETKNSSKVLIAIFSILLIVTALLQTIYHLRVKIAAEYPQFKPLLVKACEQLKCTIALPKNLDLITIGDSDMQEDDTYESVIDFSSSIRNNANYPQAYPNIELTLTNTNDQVVIKKLLTPKDYLESTDNLKDGISANEVKLINLSFYVDEAEVAGYRMLLLY